MTTPYAFGYEIGQFKFADERAERMREIEERKARLRGLGNQVKQVAPAVDDPFKEIAEIDSRANQLDRAPGSRPSGNNTGSFVGGHLTTVNGQRQPLSAAQQEDVDAANEMSSSFNNMNAGAGGAGRGGMAPAPVQPRVTLPVNRGPAAPAPAYQGRQRAPAATTPPPASGLPSMSQMFRSTPKPVSTPATTPPPARGMPSMSQMSRPMPKLPSGPTSSPDFNGAVE